MTRPRRPARAPLPPPEPRPPRRPPPEWAAALAVHRGSYFDGWRPTTIRLGAIRGPLNLPPFQRPATWTPERQVAYADSTLRGSPLAQVLLVEVGWIGTTRTYILDGQQRLTALGCDVRRHDGTPNPPTAARFDVHAGTWGDGPGTYTLHEAGQFALDLFRAAADHSEERYDGLIALHEIACRIDIPAYVRHYPTPTPEAGAEMAAAFAAINVPGTPIHPDDLAALLQFGAGWVPGVKEGT